MVLVAGAGCFVEGFDQEVDDEFGHVGETGPEALGTAILKRFFPQFCKERHFVLYVDSTGRQSSDQQTAILMQIESFIRSIPDFPKPGIMFRDFTPLLAHGPAFAALINQLKQRYAGKAIDVVVGIEARGFVLASPLAYALGAGTVLVRKEGKLPHQTHTQEYELEYGSSLLEISSDAFEAGQNILIVDDVLATGGTVGATLKLIQDHFDVSIEEILFLMELNELKGREKLSGLPIHSVFHY